MSKPVLQLVFGRSAAAALRRALLKSGRDDRLVCFPDNFSFGPIAPPDLATRARWVEAELGIAGWDRAVIDAEHALAASLSDEIRPIVWMSRRDTRSYTGFLWWLSHRPDAPCQIVDMTEHRMVDRDREGVALPPRLVVDPSALSPGDLLKLLDRAVTLPAAEREAHRDRWQILTVENAPLRVIDDIGLVSAPMRFFDPLLLSCASTSWRKMARIVGDAMARFWSEDRQQTSDFVLCGRVRALAASGVFEARGDLWKPRFCELRLAG